MLTALKKAGEPQLTKLSANIVLIQKPWIRYGKVKGFDKRSANCYYDDSCNRPKMVISQNVRTKLMPNSVFQDDANAHHTMWGRSNINIRGDQS